jgi:hypothetical protein
MLCIILSSNRVLVGILVFFLYYYCGNNGKSNGWNSSPVWAKWRLWRLVATIP